MRLRRELPRGPRRKHQEEAQRRPGLGRILSSFVLVALVVLAFGLGTDYEFTTTGLIPTALIKSCG